MPVMRFRWVAGMVVECHLVEKRGPHDRPAECGMDDH